MRRALERLNKESDRDYISRIAVTLLATMTAHLLQEGHTLTPAQVGEVFRTVAVTCDERGHITGWTYSKRTATIVITTRGDLVDVSYALGERTSFEERVVTLAAAAAYLLIHPERKFKFFLVGGSGPIAEYSVEQGRLYRLGEHPKVIELD